MAPPLVRGARVQEEVVGDDDRADERQGDERTVLRNVGHERAADERGGLLGHGGGGDEEDDGHHGDHADQRTLDHGVAAGPQDGARRERDAESPEGCAPAAEELESTGGAEEITGLVRGVPEADGGDDEDDGEPVLRRMPAPVESSPDRLPESHPAGDAEARGHLLQDDGAEGRQRERPEQGVAEVHAGTQARRDRSGPDEGRGDYRAGPESGGLHCADYT
ncbi:MAG: hypothetical protein WKG32_15380 [Gemmatimonadaceae bacterium]